MKTLKEKEHRIANIDEEIRFFYAEDVEEFIKELLKISKENNWEVAINEGYEDGFRIISGEDWIKQKSGGEE